MGPFKTCVTQEREEGRLTKNVTKSEVGEGFATKKNVMSLTQKNEILRVTFFFNGSYDNVLFCCIFYECIFYVNFMANSDYGWFFLA